MEDRRIPNAIVDIDRQTKHDGEIDRARETEERNRITIRDSEIRMIMIKG